MRRISEMHVQNMLQPHATGHAQWLEKLVSSTEGMQVDTSSSSDESDESSGADDSDPSLELSAAHMRPHVQCEANAPTPAPQRLPRRSGGYGGSSVHKREAVGVWLWLDEHLERIRSQVAGPNGPKNNVISVIDDVLYAYECAFEEMSWQTSGECIETGVMLRRAWDESR